MCLSFFLCFTLCKCFLNYLFSAPGLSERKRGVRERETERERGSERKQGGRE